MKESRAIVSALMPESIGEEIGIIPGDIILEINGRQILDELDYRFRSASEQVLLKIRRGNDEHIFEIEKEAEETLGLHFADPTFDGLRQCNNHCSFCFVDRTPKGMRKSLYIKDDDYRYSFLFATFVTLTNLKEVDWERIEEERLSPLYVSVHATDLQLRRQLLGNGSAPDIMGQLKRLIAAGIDVHTQIVLCPDLNDGEQLDRTIEDLASLYPHVLTLSVVPVGLGSRENRGLKYKGFGSEFMSKMRRHTPAEAAAVIAQVKNWQKRFREQIGLNYVYLSDEFYLINGLPMPSPSYYDGFPQYQNGVGMVRTFIDNFRALKRRLPESLPAPVRAVIACATLIAPTIEPMVAELNRVGNLEIEVITIVNTIFGDSITVSGLLSAEDLIANYRQTRPADVVYAPRNMLDPDGWQTIDSVNREELARRLGTPIIFAEFMTEVFKDLKNRSQQKTLIVVPEESEVFSRAS